MQIRQAYFSPCLSHLEPRFRINYQLTEVYGNLLQPLVVFGAYSKASIDKILAHHSLVVVVWCGQDGMLQAKYCADCMRDKKNIHHIVLSRYLEQDLQRVELPCRRLAIHPVQIDQFRSTPRGPYLFSYGHLRKPAVYDPENIIGAVTRRYPTWKVMTHEIGTIREVPYDVMHMIYGDCFLGLRLTRHDGLPATVIELGLMGRNCVCNDDQLPNALPWKNQEDVFRWIEQEQATVGMIDHSVVDRMRDFARLCRAWLDTDYYG